MHLHFLCEATYLNSLPDVLKVVFENLLLLRHHCPSGVSSLTILNRNPNNSSKVKKKRVITTWKCISDEWLGLAAALHVNRTWKCEQLWIYLCCGGGRLQQPLLLPQAAGHNAGNLHGLLQVLALEMLLDPAQIVLIEDVVLLQEAAVLLVYFPQEVVEHKCGVRLFVGSIRPWRGENPIQNYCYNLVKLHSFITKKGRILKKKIWKKKKACVFWHQIRVRTL